MRVNTRYINSIRDTSSRNFKNATNNKKRKSMRIYSTTICFPFDKDEKFVHLSARRSTDVSETMITANYMQSVEVYVSFGVVIIIVLLVVFAFISVEYSYITLRVQ